MRADVCGESLANGTRVRVRFPEGKVMIDLRGKKIAVLKGGPSSERAVSLATGAGIGKALRSLGAMVTEVDVENARFHFA